MNRDSRLIATLGAVVLTAAVLQTSIVPVLDLVSAQLHISAAAAGWVVTANLLAAAAATPLIGRLADLFNKRSVLLGALALIVAGSMLAALTSSLPLLIVGRVMQGMSFALYPVAVSILRDELPAERLIRSMAAISAMLGVGGAFGLVVTGFLMPAGASYHRVFWLSTAAAIVVTAAAVVVVPSRPHRVHSRVDWL
ncbi:MAG TPA: MFS transporter, partial [Mycobacterium sp.]|nr:MFS transporter [Mycobacterium sp.]